jgi:septal ring factor EnvC (AmiA/AmiB activator)
VLLLAALAGLIVGLLLLYLMSRRWVEQAQQAGRASRDAEVATLSEQREAADTRGSEFAARIERYERDWSSAEQNLRKLSAHAAAQQTQAEQLGHQLADARRGRDDAQTRHLARNRTHRRVIRSRARIGWARKIAVCPSRVRRLSPLSPCSSPVARIPSKRCAP